MTTNKTFAIAGQSESKIRSNNRHAALEVQESEIRHGSVKEFRDIFGQSSVGIAQTDLNGRFMFANRRYCEIVGRAAEELYDLYMQDIMHADDAPANMIQFQRLVTQGQEFTVEKRYVRPDGSCVWIHNSVSLVRDVAVNPKYAVAFTLDITRQRQIVRERERLWDRERTVHTELAEVDRRKDLFLAVLGHETVAQEMYGVIKRLMLAHDQVNQRSLGHFPHFQWKDLAAFGPA